MSQLLPIGDFGECISWGPVAAAPMPKLWYMLRLHPNYDLKAERQLHERGISAYVPKETQTVRGAWKRKIKKNRADLPGRDVRARLRCGHRSAQGQR